MQVQKKNEKLPKNKSSRRKTQVKGSCRRKNVKTSTRKTRPSPSTRGRKTSSGSLEKVVPKNKIIKQQEVDETAVKNILEKYKAKKPTRVTRRLSTTDLLTLDRVSKKSIRVPSQKSKSSKRATKSQISSANNNTLYSSHSTDEHSEDNGDTSTIKTSGGGRSVGIDGNGSGGGEKQSKEAIEDDKYDEYPKIDEVLKTLQEDVFLSDGAIGQTKWMSYIEPTDNDMIDVEPPCTVGSEQIEMYHDKKFKLHSPPEGKLRLDQWEKSKNMSKRDELFFTPQLVFSNTIRSLINVAEMGKKKSKDSGTTVNKDDALSPTQADEYLPEVTFIDVPTKKVFIYERTDPIVSASRRVEGNEADYKTDGVPVEFLHKFI